MNDQVKLFEGGIAIDDRGTVIFVNEFNFKNVKRFYLVSNYQENFIRAWHAHKKESKYVFVVSGAAIVGAVEIDNWTAPSKNLKVNRYILSERKPSILFIPAGYANGFKTLEKNTRVMFFSSSTLEEAKNDDYRFDAYYWNPWEIIPR